MNYPTLKFSLLAAITVLLAGCGGGGSGGNNASTSTQPDTNKDLFTVKGKTWIVSAEGSKCYDFDSLSEVDCTTTQWDLKLISSGRNVQLFTNSGSSGSGAGGVLYSPFERSWAVLSKQLDATKDGTQSLPATAWSSDAYSTAFSAKTTEKFADFLEYDLFGDHKLSPNFKVYLITTDLNNKATVGTAEKPVYAVQIYNYYNQAGKSGSISLRYINTRNPLDVRTIANIDASTDWAYVDLKSGSVTNTDTGTWQLAFNRYHVKTADHIGSSTAVVLQPSGFYNADGSIIKNKFQSNTVLADTLPDLQAASTQLPTVTSWTKNATTSLLNPAYKGIYPAALNYGFYTYYPSDAAAKEAGLLQHMLKANPEAATIIRGNTGQSYARLHLTKIDYADPKDYNSKMTWTFEFDIQPTKKLP